MPKLTDLIFMYDPFQYENWEQYKFKMIWITKANYAPFWNEYCFISRWR